MIIVGELINASRKAVGQAIESQDTATIQKLASDQADAGASFIDVNAGMFDEEEADYLKWVVETVQTAVETPCCIDSPDAKAIEAALSVHKGTAMVNSISLERDRLADLLPVVAGTDLKVVALCTSDGGMPETAEQRVVIAEKLVNELVRNRVAIENIYLDPLVLPIAVNEDGGKHFLKAIEIIKNSFDGINTICGLSNISYGLPQRKLLNQTFVSMAVASGLNGIIMNPLDRRMIAAIFAAETLAGRDKLCEAYLKAFRDKKLEY